MPNHVHNDKTSVDINIITQK